MAFTAAQQAEISRRYPGMEWVNGNPYTRKYNNRDENGNPITIDPYTGQPVEDDGSYTLVPAHTDEGGFPWWMLAAQIAGPAAAQGIGALAGLGSAGSAGGAGVGAGSAGTSAAVAPTVAGVGGASAGTGSGVLSAFGGIPGLAAAGGRVLGGIGAGLTANRTEADNRALTEAALAQRSAEAAAGNQDRRVGLQMQQMTAAQNEQRNAYLNALRGALAQGAADVNIDRSRFNGNIPTISFSGSPRPSQLGETRTKAGAELERQAMERLLTPTTMEKLPEYTAPETPEASQAGFWEKLLGPLSLGLNAAGALKKPAVGSNPRAFYPPAVPTTGYGYQGA